MKRRVSARYAPRVLLCWAFASAFVPAKAFGVSWSEAPVHVLVAARPGGGQSFRSSSYSSSSRSSSSSSSSRSSSSGYSGSSSSDSSGGEGIIEAIIVFIVELLLELLLQLLIELTFTYPKIMLPIWGTLILGIVLYSWSKSRKESWQLGADELHLIQIPLSPVVTVPKDTRTQREHLLALQQFDPDFSLPVFEDFVYSLFAETHRARGKNELDRVSTYVSEDARAALLRIHPQPVQRVYDVVVGAMRYHRVHIPDGKEGANTAVSPRVSVEIEFEANYAEVLGQGEKRWAVKERWRFERNRNVRSRSPESASIEQCPNCGAPREKIFRGHCSHCRKQVDRGEHDWVVRTMLTISRESWEVLGSGGEPPPSLPPKIASKNDEHWKALTTKDPALTNEKLEARVRLIHRLVNEAWSSNDWSKARALVTDPLFENFSAWIERYRAEGLRNRVTDVKLVKVQRVRVESDRYFDAVTVRISASCKDFTEDKNGNVVDGSKDREKTYHEYWTLLRGSTRKGAPIAEPQCPNCGAELKINRAGTCEYCRVKVTRGDFDWVLSKIEQDGVFEP